MKVLNAEITIQRGETFTIDYIIRNKDGSPYIISDHLTHPYFLITVSTTKYAQKDRYVKNYWLDLTGYPRFNATQAIDLHSIKKEASDESDAEPKYVSFNDITSVPFFGYVDGQPVYYYVDNNERFVNDAVFYIEHEDGTREYKYWERSKDGTGQDIGWTDYHCRLIKRFSSEDTSKWVEQSYVYSIRLVSGISTLAYLRSLCALNGITYKDTDDEETLLSKLPEDTDVDLSMPLQLLDDVRTILPATKLSVLSNIIGGV